VKTLSPCVPFLLLAVSWPVGASAQEWRAVATPIPHPPTIDGVLDEPFWSAIEPITEFRQRDPIDGAPASERTEVRIAYDENALYFGFMLFDSQPHLIRRSILQRGGRIDKDDHVWIGIDTYNDGRNAYLFEVGALGTQDDALISDESMSMDDWNWDGVYHTEVQVTDEGWALEIAIPFTTIRFGDPTAPDMGIVIRRAIRRKNEDVYWPHIGQEYRAGISQVSRYATLTGLRDLRKGRHIEVKPFVTSGAQRLAGQPETELEADVGLDVKAALTSNLTLDLTWNTDFAQVEADNVQVNLTRFNLFFPEKREFFLERAGLFRFGAQRESEVFFSRRIGLDSNIVGGGRLTGQIGRLSIGALSLRTEDTPLPDAGIPEAPLNIPAAWNSVIRLRGDVLPRTTIGAIVTSKESAAGRPAGLFEAAHNRVLGADLATRFWSSSSFLVWAANVWDSEHVDQEGGAGAAQAELVLRNDRYFLELTRTHIGSAFAPALGFVPRPDQERWGGQMSFTPRFEQSTWARQLTLNVGGNHIAGTNGVKQSHFGTVSGTLNFQSGESLSASASEHFERLAAPATIAGRSLPEGDYLFRSASGHFRMNQSRTFSASFDWSVGDFWSGSRTQLGGGVVWKTSEYLTLGGNLGWNDVSLPVSGGDFSTTLVGFDVQGAVSRKLFANALVQWDDVANTLQANVRVDWIHTPGSDLFVVIDTGYLTGDQLDPLAGRWLRRTGIVKLTWLKAF
jgi:hypothetical protein